MENKFEVGDLVYHKTDIKRRNPMTVTSIVDYSQISYDEFFSELEQRPFFSMPRNTEIKKMYQERINKPMEINTQWLNYHGKVNYEKFLAKVLVKAEDSEN